MLSDTWPKCDKIFFRKMTNNEKFLPSTITCLSNSFRSKSYRNTDRKLILISLTTITLLFIWLLYGLYYELNHNSVKHMNYHINSYSEYMIIDKKPRPCSDSAHLLVICFTAPGNFAARSAIRDTWGSVARDLGTYFYFLIGRADDDPTLQDQIYEEDLLYRDILEADFTDSYYNLTLKSIHMMRWISDWECAKTALRFVFKVDDDMLVNVGKIYDYTKSLANIQKTFIGRLGHKWKPFRDPEHKYYVSEKAFPERYFPDFVTGPAYMFTTDLAKPLYEAASTDDPSKVLILEDVYMTGILGERLAINRLNHTNILNLPISEPRVTKKNFDTVWTSHMYLPMVLRDRWRNICVLTRECVEFCDL